MVEYVCNEDTNKIEEINISKNNITYTVDFTDIGGVDIIDGNDETVFDGLTKNGIYLYRLTEGGITYYYPFYNSYSDVGRQVKFNPDKGCFSRRHTDRSFIYSDWADIPIDGSVIKNGSISLEKLNTSIQNKLRDSYIVITLNNDLTNISYFGINHTDITTNILANLRYLWTNNNNNIIFHIRSFDNATVFKFEKYVYNETAPYIIFSSLDYDTLNTIYYKVIFGDTNP